MQTKVDSPAAQLPQTVEARNPGMELDMDWVMGVQANTSAIERRCATLPGRRSVKKDHQAAWLLRAITLIDLTTLSGDDTEARVRRLCAKARQPVRADLLDRLGVPGVTFKYSENGPEGLAGGRKVVIASARGGEYSTDQLAENQESLLTTFFGFIGVDDLHSVRVEKAGFGPEAIEQGMNAAKQEIAKL